MTNLDRLTSTLQHANKFWRAEQHCQKKNAVNETAWSGQVVQQMLAALEWPRLPRKEANGTGAYFEWPAKHRVDVALLQEGRPSAFLELKQTHPGCRNDLHRKLKAHPELRSAVFGVAAWFYGEAGFCIYEIGPASSLTAGAIVSLSDACNDPSALARLASPLLRGQVPDLQSWLLSPSPEAGPIVPRHLQRDIQRRFFVLLKEVLLKEKLRLSHSLQPRRSFTKFDPPTPTFAFTELPGVLPAGWGLTFDFDSTMSQLQCFFYRTSATKMASVGKWNFENGDLSDPVLIAFLKERVMPKIQQWRNEAIASGMLP